MPLYRVRIRRDNAHPAVEYYVTNAETPRKAVERVEAHIMTERSLSSKEYNKYYRLVDVTEATTDVLFMMEVPQ